MPLGSEELLQQVSKTLNTTSHTKAVFSSKFLDRLSQEAETVLLNWLVRNLYWGSEDNAKLEAGLTRLHAAKPELLDQINERIDEVCNHSGKNFRTELSAALAEVLALDDLIGSPHIETQSVNLINVSAKEGVRTPDIEMVTDQGVCYCEVKHMQDEDDLDQQLTNRLLQQSILRPELFAHRFTVYPHISDYTIRPQRTRQFAELCIEQLAIRSEIEGEFHMKSDQFPGIAADITVEEGPEGVQMVPPIPGGGRKETFLSLGHIYGRIIVKIHDAFTQLTQFREQGKLPSTCPDWIYLKTDSRDLTQFLHEPRYRKTLNEIINALNLDTWARIMINGRLYGSDC